MRAGQSFVNEGTIIVDRALQFSLGGIWHNRGTIDVTNALVILAGTFTTADIGDYHNSTGRTSLRGTLDNTNSTLLIDGTTGSWDLDTGSVLTGGTVQIVSGTSLTSNGGTLKDVTAQGDFAAGTLRLVGDITIAGTVSMNTFFFATLAIGRRLAVPNAAVECPRRDI